MIDSNIKLSWLIEDRINIDNISKLLEINGIQICPNAEDVTIEDIKLANKSGVRVRLWGVSNEDIMRKAFNFNIDGMTVNFPDKLKELMEEKYNGCKF